MSSTRSRRRHRSKRPRRPSNLRILATLGIPILALFGGLVLGERISRDGPPETPDRVAHPGRQGVVAASAAGERKVYPYSIVEGGAATVEELKTAIDNDPVVAKHFKGFDLSKTRVETLAEPKIAHVSYRRGDAVFWTRKPVVVPAGETVLTDGTNYARTRCGNCLSTGPASPVSDAEPAAHVLDTPTLEFRRAGLPPAGITVLSQSPAGGLDSTAAGNPGSTSRSTTGAGPSPSGGIGTRGSPSGTGGTGSTTPGLQAPGDEGTDPGRTEVSDSFGMKGAQDAGGPGHARSSGNPGNSGDTGPGNTGNSGNPGNSGTSGNSANAGNSGDPKTSANHGTPGNPQGPPDGPPSPPGSPDLPPNNPIVPPPFVPPAGSDPALPIVLPLDDPFNPPGGPFDPQSDTFSPPGGPIDPPKDLIAASDAGAPGRQTDTRQVETIAEPATTGLVLLGIAYAVRRLRKRPDSRASHRAGSA